MALNNFTSRPSLDELIKLNLTKQLEIMHNLYTLWETVGIDEEQKLDRATQVWNYVFELLYDIEHEEDTLVKEIKERLKNYAKKISVLSAELQLPKTGEFTGSLVQQEQTLRHLLDEMSKIKHRRLREFHELRMQELKYGEVLGVTPLSFFSPTGVPSEKDIQELQQQVKKLQEEKEKRQQQFHKLKKELSTILEVTEQSPDKLFEKELHEDEEGKLSLSIEKLKQLEQIVAETKKRQSDLENEKFCLMEKLSLLWDNLEINVSERELFLSKYSDCRTSNLNALKEEIARCEEIKKQNFVKQVSSLNEEVKSLCTKCFVVPSENMLLQIQGDEISESVFENYSNELKKLKKYYKDIEHIIQMIAKRKELWEKISVFENKAADPNRFKNRGGNLLKEEKQRKQLQKSLSELEEKIIINIQNYEKENGKQFLYYGEKFEDFMKKQWEDRVNQKENEKLSKKKMRLEELRTPSKQSIRTPKSASKVLRSVGTSIFKTPNFSLSKQSSHTPISHLNNQKDALNIIRKPKRSILKDKNRNKLSSQNLDSTTYVEFASKLNRSSRIYHRSSVVSSKRTVQTRNSLNKNGKTTQRSLQKK